jgi:hypothetical protein
MNERIKELLEQAGPLQEVLSEITEQTNDKGPRYIRSMTLLDFQLKKFAELIVGECMRMCDVAAIGYESHNHFKEANGCYSAKEYIKEHFGVEE